MGKKPVAAAQHICGRCTETFHSKKALSRHLKDHEDSEPTFYTCPVCKYFFPDSLLLEQHRILNSHWELAQFGCDRCTQIFETQQGYNRHRKHGQPCCDAFHYKDWKKSARPECVGTGKPRPISGKVVELEYGGNSTGTPSDMSDGREFCHYCKKTFASEFAYDRHLLGCTALNMKLTPHSPPETLGGLIRGQNVALPSPKILYHTVNIEAPTFHAPTAANLADAPRPTSLQPVALHTKVQVPRQPPPAVENTKNVSPVQGTSMPVTPCAKQGATSQRTGTGTYICNVSECQRSYNSEQGLKMHQIDAHGVGGECLDLYGKDSWMLGQGERERLKAECLLVGSKNASRGGKNNRSGSRRGHTAPLSAATRAPPLAVLIQHEPATHSPYHQALQQASMNVPSLPLSTNIDIGDALEMEQAKSICGKMLRLLLQTDIFIHHDGKMSVSSINWTRIGVRRQPDAIGMFESMCHLPRKLQAFEYVPAPKTFLTEYKAQYPVTCFESAPARDPARPGLDIIAMACSRITLSNRCHEVVKIAVVDVLTCRVLMSHLVCTDPRAQVANWHSSVTGLASFRDIEETRLAGYKVLKGWAAARSALFKFIDKDTIIVGHNLRSELDALRIVHGRAVDIVKVIEKAAQGPLSKAQVNADSWCRDVAKIARLRTDPVFGRDCVMGAFAAREIGLWSIKNREMFEQVAKQKTREYQLVTKA